jgi:hypothetical protein
VVLGDELIPVMFTHLSRIERAETSIAFTVGQGRAARLVRSHMHPLVLKALAFSLFELAKTTSPLTGRVLIGCRRNGDSSLI